MDTSVTIVILAGEDGAKMRSRQPVALHQVGGKTLIEHAVDAALHVAAPDQVFVTLGHEAESVRAIISDRRLRFLEQPEQEEPGGALVAFRQRVWKQDELLLLYYADCPLIPVSILSNLVAHQRASAAAATILTARIENPAGFMCVNRDSQALVRSLTWKEAKSADEAHPCEVNIGICCVRGESLRRYLDDVPITSSEPESLLPGLIESMVRAGHHVGVLPIEDAPDVLRVRNLIELSIVDNELRARKVRELMLGGVTIQKPETVTIDPEVQVGLDTVIEPFVQMTGKTSVGENCRIGACSIISDSELSDGVQVGPFTFIGTSRVGRGARIGPYARLRQDNDVGEDAQIGNFVELKSTQFGPSSKAKHLAYLGDATIGARVNIGAGTITCNYDGLERQRTGIGERTFVGSNSSLVAPVQIGADAYIGAGSVITDKVPPGALALARSRQVNKEGWTGRRRKK